MNSISQIFLETPWWVFALFFYLLKVGVNATKTKVTSIKKLFILPVGFLLISTGSLLYSFPFLFFTFFAYMVSLAIGTSVGWMLVKNLKLSFDHTKQLVKMPGSYVTLILILLVFSTKYCMGYLKATCPELLNQSAFVVFQFALSGICSGLFLGRLVCYLLKKNRSHHEDLQLEKEVSVS